MHVEPCALIVEPYPAEGAASVINTNLAAMDEFQPAYQLVYRPLFPHHPDENVIKDFMRWLRQTGQPETFPQISTSKPPIEGDLAILADRLHVDRNKRPYGDAVPCAYCSQSSGKWLSGGFLIWCAATQAIYVVGPQCGSDGVWARKIQLAANIFIRTSKERRTKELLAAQLVTIPARCDWINAVRAQAKSCDRAMAELDAAPRLAEALRRAFKSDHLVGAGDGAFFRKKRGAEADLDQATADLQALLTQCQGDPHDWVDALAATNAEGFLQQARQADHRLASVHRKIVSAVSFFSEAGMDALSAWQKSGYAPAGLEFRRTHSKIELLLSGQRASLASAGNVSPTAVPKP